MPKRASIDFVVAKNDDLADLRFGGEPFGLPSALWPKSKSTQEVMQFICQIPFDSGLIPGAEKSVAYLFIANGDGNETWLPNGGENAVVILRENQLTNSLTVGDSPRLIRMVKHWWNSRLVPEACSYVAKLTFSDDPDYIPASKLQELPSEQVLVYRTTLEGNKLGGSPGFLQFDELPFSEKWQLLLQLDSTKIPFWINFGDAGVGYLFLNEAGKEGKFLWQCL